MDTLKSFRKTLDEIPKMLELILVIFFDGFYGGLYRMTSGTVEGVVIGILWLLVAYGMAGIFGLIGGIALPVLTICDIISVLIYGKPTVLA